MNSSDDSSEANDPDIDPERLTEVLEHELTELLPDAAHYDVAELSITFMDAAGIRELNREYRDVDEPTDVLSFPMLDDNIPALPVLYLGDIVICPEQTMILHPELSRREALCLMTVHSFLHLLGYDHDTDANEELMYAQQERIFRELMGGAVQ